MITLSLNDEQAAVLRDTLESDLSDLSVEIASTDRMEYRDEIKRERERLREILSQLEHRARAPGGEL